MVKKSSRVKTEPGFFGKIFYHFAYCFTHFLSFLFFPVKVYGLENIPKSGSFILACNHLSNIDPFIVRVQLPVSQKVNFVAKKSLFAKPLVAKMFLTMGAFPVERGASDFGAIRETIRRIQSGHPMMVFPEGTRKRGQEGSADVKSGVGFLVRKTHVPVVPVCIVGSEKVLPPGAKFFHRTGISIYFGKPLRFDAAEKAETISQDVMQEVYRLPQNSS